MAYVRKLGDGYYGIETEGIGGVSQDVWKRIDKAFKDATAAPADKLKVRTLRKARLFPKLRSK